MPACMLAPWKSGRGGGLALAACRLSCARHPPRPPTATPVGALAEVRYLRRGFVVVLQPASSACAWEPAAAAWEGACGHGIVFSSFRAGAGWLRLPERVPLCRAFCTGVYVPVSLCRIPWPKSKVPRSEPRAACPWEQTSLLPLPQHLAFLSQFLPPAASPSPCWVRAKCPRCHRAHVSAVVPSTLGAVPPRAPDKASSVGDRVGLGGPGWDVSPRIPIRKGSVFTPVAGGGLRGLCTARFPPPPGRGKGGLSAAPWNKESVWLMTALRKRGETNVPLIGGEVT